MLRHGLFAQALTQSESLQTIDLTQSMNAASERILSSEISPFAKSTAIAVLELSLAVEDQYFFSFLSSGKLVAGAEIS